MAQDWEGLTIGATLAGWVSPVTSATRAAFASGLRRLTGFTNLVTSPGSFFGNLIDDVNDGYQAALQGIQEGIAQTFFTSASGVFLDRLVAPLNTRLPATPSTAALFVYGAPGTDVTAGSQVRVSQVSTAFSTTTASGPLDPINASAGYAIEVAPFDAAAELGETFTLTVDGTPFARVVGALDTAQTVLDSLVSDLNIAALSQGGLSVGVNPTNARPGAAIIDSLGVAFTISFTYTGASPLPFLHSASIVPSEANVDGPTEANALTLRRIVTPIAGWEGVTNLDPAILGRDLETDANFRTRYRAQLRTPGGRNADAIRARVLLPVERGGGGASFCTIESNPDGVTDAVGNVEHSIRVIVGPDDDTAAAAQAAFLVKSAGDDTNGAITETVTDVEGKTFPFRIDVLAFQYIWAEIEVEPGEGWPTVGDPFAGVAQDVADFVEQLGTEQNKSGEDVRVGDLPIASFPDGTPRGVNQFRVRLAVTPTPVGPPVYGPWYPDVEPDQEAASIAISSREKARGSVARVFVTAL